MCRNYGYVRVSSADQNAARQIDAMEKAGIAARDIYVDKMSGKDFRRPSWIRLVRKAKSGDAIFVKSLDRLGRNYDEIEEQWDSLQRKGVDIVVMDMPLLDTREGIDGLTGRFIADIVLKVLSYVAQMERENIHQRQMEGIAAAKKRGVKCGRPENPLPENFHEVLMTYRSGDCSIREAARLLNMKSSTFYHHVKKYSGENTV